MSLAAQVPPASRRRGGENPPVAGQPGELPALLFRACVSQDWHAVHPIPGRAILEGHSNEALVLEGLLNGVHASGGRHWIWAVPPVQNDDNERARRFEILEELFDSTPREGLLPNTQATHDARNVGFNKCDRVPGLEIHDQIGFDLLARRGVRLRKGFTTDQGHASGQEWSQLNNDAK